MSCKILTHAFATKRDSYDTLNMFEYNVGTNRRFRVGFRKVWVLKATVEQKIGFHNFLYA